MVLATARKGLMMLEEWSGDQICGSSNPLIGWFRQLDSLRRHICEHACLEGN
jgi:hypothetical protein